MRAALTVAAALLLGATTAARVEVTADNARSFYQSFDRLTGEPKEVSAWLFGLCRGWTPADAERERERAGPHALARVHLYSHGVERSVFADRERQFPVGAIVVKEKLESTYTTAGIGGMQKMEPGYDTEGGDWRYFYWSPADGFTSGRLDNCRSCHLGAKRSDFVFYVSSGSYLVLPPASR